MMGLPGLCDQRLCEICQWLIAGLLDDAGLHVCYRPLTIKPLKAIAELLNALRYFDRTITSSAVCNFYHRELDQIHASVMSVRLARPSWLPSELQSLGTNGFDQSDIRRCIKLLDAAAINADSGRNNKMSVSQTQRMPEPSNNNMSVLQHEQIADYRPVYEQPNRNHARPLGEMIYVTHRGQLDSGNLRKDGSLQDFAMPITRLPNITYMGSVNHPDDPTKLPHNRSSNSFDLRDLDIYPYIGFAASSGLRKLEKHDSRAPGAQNSNNRYRPFISSTYMIFGSPLTSEYIENIRRNQHRKLPSLFGNHGLEIWGPMPWNNHA